ncbi:hypothetical protein EVAR_39892_1 [Eumeta japonica]|uniref:Uncharacterized protein n=1 Tax=Eumeta variegata TaxID=151549 RepID=A0A4C1WN36_EUMVA|nr:hypothetical protein EVAR_39892_1 [Eumeta japonica]
MVIYALIRPGELHMRFDEVRAGFTQLEGIRKQKLKYYQTTSTHLGVQRRHLDGDHDNKHITIALYRILRRRVVRELRTLFKKKQMSNFPPNGATTEDQNSRPSNRLGTEDVKRVTRVHPRRVLAAADRRARVASVE